EDARSGLAVAIDIGDRYDIHPANKQQVGKRLARAARKAVYGEHQTSRASYRRAGLMAFNKASVGGTLTVALLLCLVCGIVVAAAAVGLRRDQDKTRRLDNETTILQPAGWYEPVMDVAAACDRLEGRFVDLDSGEHVEMPESYDQRKAAKDPQASIALNAADD